MSKEKAKEKPKPETQGKKGKKGKKGEAEEGAGGIPSVATHPRARTAVRRAKGWGGLGGFGLAANLSLRAGVPPPTPGCAR